MFQRLIARISESHTRWIAWGMAVGVLSGLSAALFFVALEYATHLTMHELVGAAPPAPPGDVFFPPSGDPAAEPRRWLLFLLPDQIRLERCPDDDLARFRKLFLRWSIVGWIATVFLYRGLWVMTTKPT